MLVFDTLMADYTNHIYLFYAAINCCINLYH